MKKLFIFLLFAFLSFNLFSEEFSLFPWFCNQKDIYTQCINKGWKFQSDTSSKIPYYIFYTPDDVTFHELPVFAVHFLFNENNTVVSQSVTFPKLFEATDTFPTILELVLADKAQLLEKKIDTTYDTVKITYTGIVNNIKVQYVIRGKDDAYQLSVTYINY